MDHAIVYSSALSLFLIATAVLFGCNFRNWKSNVVNPLSCSYVLVMVSLLADIFWIFIDGNPEYVIWNHVLNIIEFCTFGLCGYCWLIYCFDFFPFAACKKRWVKVLAFFPVGTVMLLTVLSSITGWLYTIDENSRYQRGPYFFLQQIGYIYAIITAVLAICSTRMNNLTTSQKRHYLVIAVFPVPPVVLGIVQIFAPVGMVPSMQFSIFVSLLLTYVEEQNRRITHDSLTKLRNRYEFERLLKDRMLKYRRNSQNPLYVLLGDMDHFKRINDTLGHLEGDRALKLVSWALESCAKNCGAVVARVSGDEFCAFLEGSSLEAPMEFCRNVQEKLDTACASEKFKLSVSIGVVHYDGEMSLLELLNEVDKDMYRVKNEKFPG